MKKKLLSLVLVMSMLLSMFPVTALADEAGTSSPAAENSTNGVHVEKTLVTTGSVDRIKLEAWTTGSTETTTQTVPTDIVLVLDQSGSMDDYVQSEGKTKLEIMRSAVTTFVSDVQKLNGGVAKANQHRVAIVGFASETGYGYNTEVLTLQSTEEHTVWSYVRVADTNMLDEDETYYIQDGEDYRRIRYYDRSGQSAAGWYTVGSWGRRGEAVNVASTPVYEHKSTTQTVPAGAGVYYTDLMDMSEDDRTEQYANSLVECDATAIGTTGAIGQAIAALDGNGATRADLGMEMAASIFAAQPTGTYADGARNKVVVFLTDGVPTTASEFSSTVANVAVDAAYDMKSADAHVFSLYLGTPTNQAANFMQAVSSNYPEATSITSLGTQHAQTYYAASNSSASIQTVFTNIVTSINTNTDINEESVVQDVLTEHFKLAGNGDVKEIQVFTVDATSDGWSNEEKAFDANVTVGDDGKTIRVTNFSFVNNCVTTTPKDGVGGSDYGRKLVIYIPIAVDPDDSSATFGGYLPTNESAGILKDASSSGYYLSADGPKKDVPIRYTITNAERAYQAPNGSAEYSHKQSWESVLKTDGVLTEMIAANMLPNKVRNEGVTMTYHLLDTKNTTSTDGNTSDDEVVATLTVNAGESVDITDLSKWTFNQKYSLKETDDEGNPSVTLSLAENKMYAERLFVLSCRLTSTSGDTNATYMTYGVLDLNIARSDYRTVYAIIDQGGNPPVPVEKNGVDGIQGDVVDLTYTEAVHVPYVENGVTKYSGSDGVKFTPKDNHVIRAIYLKVGGGALTPIYDESNVSLSNKQAHTVNIQSEWDADGKSWSFYAPDVTVDITVEVYTRPVQYVLTTDADDGSNIMPGHTFDYEATKEDNSGNWLNPLRVNFTAKDGYHITKIEVDDQQHTAEKLLNMTDAERKNLGIVIRTEDSYAEDGEAITVIKDGEVLVNREKDHTVKVWSEEKYYKLTYEYYQKNGTYTKENNSTETKYVPFGAKLLDTYKPSNMPGVTKTVDESKYVLSSFYEEATGVSGNTATGFRLPIDLDNATMPASDLTLYAYWDKVPDQKVAEISVVKNLNEVYTEDQTFTFHALFHEHTVGEVELTVTKGNKTATGKMEIVMTALQASNFEDGNGYVYIHEHVDTSDHTWIYDNSRYELRYATSGPVLYLNGEAKDEASFTNTRFTYSDLFVEKVVSKINETVITYDADGNPTNMPSVSEDDVITWTITVTNKGNAVGEFTLDDVLTYEGSTDKLSPNPTITLGDGAGTNGTNYTVPAKSASGDGTAIFTATYTVKDSDAGKSLVNTVTIPEDPEKPTDSADPVDIAPYTVTYVYEGYVPNDAEDKTGIDNNNGNGYAYNAEVDVREVPAPTQSGYTFSGWTTDDATITDGKFIITQHTTLVGKWTKADLSVSEKELTKVLPEGSSTPKLSTDDIVVGDTIFWTITIANNGDAEGTVESIVDTIRYEAEPGVYIDLTDENGNVFRATVADETDFPLTVAAGQTAQVVVSWTVTEEAAGKTLVNNAKVKENDPGKNSEEVEIAGADLSVEKIISKVGDTDIIYGADGKPTNIPNVTKDTKIEWTITVTNSGKATGEFTLSDVLNNVKDTKDPIREPQITTMAIPDQAGVYTVAANGGTVVFTVTYTVTAEDAKGSLVNTVTITDTTDPDDSIKDESDPVDVAPYTVTYVYDTQYPNAPAEPVDNHEYAYGADVTVQAAKLWPGWEFAGWTIDGKPVEPGGTFEITKHTTIVGSWIKNEAELTVKKEVASIVSEDGSIKYKDGEQTGDVVPGDTITWIITVTNTGDASGLVVLEDKLSNGEVLEPVGSVDGDNTSGYVVPANDSIEIIVTYEVKEPDGGKSLVNEVAISDPGDPEKEPIDEDESDPVDVYPYTVTYKDGVGGDLFKDEVHEYLSYGRGTPAFGSDKENEEPVDEDGNPVRPGYKFLGWEPELADTVTGHAVYVAQWNKDKPVIPDDPEAGVSVRKRADVDSAEVGDEITYTIRVRNTGNVDLFWVEVYDTMLDETYYIDWLPVGDTWKTTYTYTVTEEDAGSTLVNTVVVYDLDYGDLGSDTVETEIEEYDDKPSRPVMPELNLADHIAYIIGYEDGTVRPQNNITRAEVATIFFRLLTEQSRAFYWSQSNEYNDVKITDWFNNAISTLSNAGIITGYPDGSFQPNAPITRAEFAAIAARFSEVVYNGGNHFTDVPENHWAARYIALAEYLGWINGYPDGTFKPDQDITRAEAMTLINRVLERAVQEEHMLYNMVVWSDNKPGAWYYEAVQEATNSHTYVRIHKLVPDQDFNYELWLAIQPVPDWAALEKSWSTANSH